MQERHLNSSTRELVASRLLQHVRESGDCWLWTGAVNCEGYARIRVLGDSSKWAIHRASYEAFVGPIPDGLTIDHLCRNPGCINPAHLEAVTMEENIRRGHGIGMRNASKTSCHRGHPYTESSCRPEQRGQGKLGRRCVICRREREKRNRHAARASRQASVSSR